MCLIKKNRINIFFTPDTEIIYFSLFDHLKNTCTSVILQSYCNIQGLLTKGKVNSGEYLLSLYSFTEPNNYCFSIIFKGEHETS